MIEVLVEILAENLKYRTWVRAGEELRPSEGLYWAELDKFHVELNQSYSNAAEFCNNCILNSSNSSKIET